MLLFRLELGIRNYELGMGAKKKVLEIRKLKKSEPRLRSYADVVLYYKGKKTEYEGKYVNGYNAYNFDYEIDVKKYPEILNLTVAEIPDPIDTYIELNRLGGGILLILALIKIDSILHLNYLLSFDEKNTKILCKSSTLCHRVMVELDNAFFIENGLTSEGDGSNIFTNAEKTYTNPSLILGDLIKADVKIIDAVIKKVNK